MKDYFQSLLEKQVIVLTRSGSRITGTLVGFDEHHNIHLIDSDEQIFTQEVSDEKGPSMDTKYSTRNIKSKSLWIRGDTVITVALR
mmetsp:Transcript_24047/g.37459  ORF Transcript_24047/g.37459 Transcript_24047/m.37459 type:complete len:86 (-) Transcript_24047:13-270(-)